MEYNKRNIFSALFLFIFISAFSTGIYSSLNNSLKSYSLSHKELNQNSNTNNSSNDLVFEETENDVEDLTSPEFTLLPQYLNLNTFTSILISNPDFQFSEKATGPIFLAIRALRI